MKTSQYAKWQLKKMKAKRERDAPENMTVHIVLDFGSSKYDITDLAGWPYFEKAIHEIAPTVLDWEWSTEQIQEACRISHFSYANFEVYDTEKYTIPVNGCTREQLKELAFKKKLSNIERRKII